MLIEATKPKKAPKETPKEPKPKRSKKKVLEIK
jgi:hypothetical protein